MKPLSSVVNLFTELNRLQISYCHWKSNEHLSAGLNGTTDLDILADINEKDQLSTILQKHHYISMVSQYGSRYPFVEDWIGMDLTTGKLIHIHLHYKIVTGHTGLKEYVLPWTELCLKTRKLDESCQVYVTEPNLELIILAVRIGLKLKAKQYLIARQGAWKCKAEDIREFKYLKALVEWDKVDKILSEYFLEEHLELLNLLKSDKYNSKWILKLHRLVIKHGNKWSRIDFPMNQISRAYFAFILPFRYALKKYLGFNVITRKTFKGSNGLMIAFVGQDGAGKSTITKDAVKWLSWKADAKQYYLGSGDHYKSFNKKLVNLLSKSDNVVLRVIRITASITDLKHLAKKSYKTVRTAEKYKKMGGIALFDRYPQVQFAGINDGPKIRSILEKKKVNPLIRFYVNHSADVEEKYLKLAADIAPDLVFKLMLSPEESIIRKPEESYEVVFEKHNIIKELAFTHSDIHVVDAAQDYTREKIEIYNVIWNKLLSAI